MVWTVRTDFANDLKGHALEYFRGNVRNIEIGLHEDIYAKPGNYLIYRLKIKRIHFHPR